MGVGVAVAAALGSVVARRRGGDQLLCVPLSLTAVFYAGTVGYVAARAGPPESAILLAASAAFAAAILLLRVTDCGRTCLTMTSTLCALIAAVAAVGATWRLESTASGAALAVLSLAIIGFAPRIAMVLSGTGPAAASIDAALCHRTLTGLVLGASTAAALGAATVVSGLTLRDLIFAAVVALVLLLRARTHVDSVRRAGLVAAAVIAAMAGFVAAAVAFPPQATVVCALTATAGAAALSVMVGPTVTPIIVRTTEVVEYLALAAVVPLACWVGGLYGWARGMNLL
jgi:type VII secretion integral membrane protein EccD